MINDTYSWKKMRFLVDPGKKLGLLRYSATAVLLGLLILHVGPVYAVVFVG